MKFNEILDLTCCPVCEEDVCTQEYNSDAAECRDCHAKAYVDYDECGCDQCFEKYISKSEDIEQED